MARRLDVDESQIRKGYDTFKELLRECLEAGRGLILKDFVHIYLHERAPKAFYDCKKGEMSEVGSKMTYKARMSTSLRRKMEKGYRTKREMRGDGMA